MHYNAFRGSSVAEAAGTGQPDALLVVGVLFEVGVSGEPQALTSIADGVAQAAQVCTLPSKRKHRLGQSPSNAGGRSRGSAVIAHDA